jgi:UPF0755 protein
MFNNEDDIFPLDRESEVDKIIKGAHGKRKQKKRKKLLIFFVVAFLAMGAAGGVFAYNYLQGGKDYTGLASNDALEKVNVTIPQGASITKIAQILLDNDVIASTKAFINAVNSNNTQKSPSYGTFTLKKRLSGKSALDMLLNKDNLLKIKFVIPEGYTAKQVAEVLKKDPNLKSDEVDKAFKNAPNFLPAEAKGSLEGWLFPATYEFEFKTTAEEIFKFMINKTVEILKKHSVSAENYETIINKASIIQREVRHQEDMPKVARVIENRLKIDMPLGIDSVVAYGLNGGESNSLEIPQADLDDPNAPYNSRIKIGLPPTPISNPGEDAIAAAITPAEGSWLYFCTTNPDTGETEFLTTESEFNAAKAKYKQWLSRQ